MHDGAQRETSRAVLAVCWRPALAFVERCGLLSELRLHLPEDTAALVAAPPSIWTWMDARHFDALYVAVAGLTGDRQLLRDLGRDSARESVPLMLSVLTRAVVTLLDGTPSALFSRIDRLGASMSRPWHARWLAESPRSGVVELEFPGGLPPQPSLDALEGSLMHLFDLANTTGFVGDRSVSHRQRLVRFRVRW